MDYSVGQKLYRFEFRLKKKDVARTEVEVINSDPRKNSLLLQYVVNGRQQRSYLYVTKIGIVTTRCSSRYVIIPEDDVEQAKAIVREYLVKRIEDERKVLSELDTSLEVLDGLASAL